jgi:hypothetical protein
MRRRGSRPSLYEVAQSRLDREGQGAQAAGEESSQQKVPPRRVTPGSSLRLPFGFVAMILVLGVGLVLVAWWAGRGAGVEEARQDMETRSEVRMIADPLAIPPQVEPAAVPIIKAAPVQPVSAAVSPLPAAVVQGDPRVPGLSYFVLVETRPQGAREIAEFCRRQGLEVAVVLSHNARSAKVVALPGLFSDRMSDPAVQALDAKIAAIGRLWRESGRQSNFSDRYQQRKSETP